MMRANLRVQYGRYIEDEAYNSHKEYIKKNADVFDEITIFVEYSMHGYWTKEFDSDMAVILEKVINDHKKIGIKSVGINVLNTIGHLEEAWDLCLSRQCRRWLEQTVWFLKVIYARILMNTENI